MNAERAVASTRDPAFAVDSGGELLAWNQAAEGLLGYPESQVLGRPCWEILAGRDIFGNDYCWEGCPLIRMARRQRALRRCEICFRTSSGRFAHLGVSTMVVDGAEPPDIALVHLLTPVAPAGTCEEPVPWRLCASRPVPTLTPRQSEVLRLLSDGKGTTEIAALLFISPATARNHIKNILSTLHVHSRLEAVSLARRVGLLESGKERE